MNRVIKTLAGAALGVASFALPAESTPPQEALAADIVFLGEQHDNPAHHAAQAAWVSALSPTALVFEMVTPAQAARISSDIRTDEAALASALEWEASGWPDFAMYFPIFEAAPEATVYGAAVPRDMLRDMMGQDVVKVIGQEAAARFGLDKAVPADQQIERLALQKRAHCDALPEDLLPRMINVQRVRDAVLAQAALEALETLGPPIVVITGNGHARKDWGAPFKVLTADAAVSVFSLGQGEAGQMPDGGFDLMIDGPPVDRGDPCDVFKK